MIETVATRPARQAPGRREKRKLEIRERIENAAYALFRMQGIEEASIEQICIEADVARRTFYSHYPNKQALLASLSYNRIWSTADELINDIMENHDTAWGRVSAMIDYMETNMAGYGDVDRALMRVTRTPLTEHTHLREVSNSLQDHLVRFFRIGRDNGDTTSAYSPELLGETIMGTINTILAAAAADAEYPLIERLEEARKLFKTIVCS